MRLLIEESTASFHPGLVVLGVRASVYWRLDNPHVCRIGDDHHWSQRVHILIGQQLGAFLVRQGCIPSSLPGTGWAGAIRSHGECVLQLVWSRVPVPVSNLTVGA